MRGFVIYEVVTRLFAVFAIRTVRCYVLESEDRKADAVEDQAMSWYQCSCGFMTEMTPRFGDTITSVIHLHRSARVDGGSGVVRMEEVADSFPLCQIACALPNPALSATARGVR
jgi:hypothetical protein